jgi:hypothetical protein
MPVRDDGKDIDPAVLAAQGAGPAITTRSRRPCHGPERARVPAARGLPPPRVPARRARRARPGADGSTSPARRAARSCRPRLRVRTQTVLVVEEACEERVKSRSATDAAAPTEVHGPVRLTFADHYDFRSTKQPGRARARAHFPSRSTIARPRQARSARTGGSSEILYPGPCFQGSTSTSRRPPS